jgi:nuclear pore complex protein Nup98-Nup96
MSAPSGGFGTGGSTFGSTTTGTTGGFGAAPSTSTFGGTSNSSPFGAPAPAPSAFGGPSSGFGGTGGSTFGAPSPSPAFGGGGFGSTTTNTTTGAATFGGGGFGGTTSSTFGAPAPASAFGTGGGFGAPSPASGTTGLFGAPAPAPTGGMFGGTSTTSTFGSSPGGTGLFGGGSTLGGTPGQPAGQAPAWAASLQLQGNGTRQTPYAPTTRADGQSSIVLQTITAMPPYENYSLEELRLQDYAMGNRGAAGPAPGAPGGMFGAPGGFGAPAAAPTGGLFGSPAPAPSAFGVAPATSTGFGGFGSTAPAPFGAPAPSAFGASPSPAPAFGSAPTSTFGATTPGGAFGQPSPAPAPGSLFGGGGGAFGAPASGTPAPSTGLFGSTPGTSTMSGFGQPAPSPGGGLFGGGGGFGSAPTPAPGTTGAFGFGGSTSAPASTGLFGAPAPGPAPGSFGGGFGAPAAPSAFGAAPSTGLFGGAQTGQPSAFGQPAPAPAFGVQPLGGGTSFGPSAFGQPSPAPSLGFGAQTNAGGGTAFGAQPAGQAPTMIHPTGNIMPPATNELVLAQLAAMEAKRKEMEKNDNFQNQPLASSTVTAASQSESSALRSLTTMRPSYPVYHALSPSGAMIRPRGFASPPDNGISSHSLSNLGAGGRPIAAPEIVAAIAPTRLTINPKSKPKLKLTFTPSKSVGQNGDSVPKIAGGDAQASSTTNGDTGVAGLRSPAPPGPVSTPEPSGTRENYTRTPGSASTTGSTNKSALHDVGYEHYQKAAGLDSGITATKNGANTTPGLKISPVAPKLSKPEYSCNPSILELQRMAPEELAAVSNFSVERAGVGKVEWQGAVDVRYADLDSLVVIEPKSIIVYAEEEINNTKPPVGTKLNRPAILTMWGVVPREGADPAKFASRVASQTEKMGASLIKFDVETGEWVLLVEHFR